MGGPVSEACPRCAAVVGDNGVCARCLLGAPTTGFDLLEEIGRGGMGTVWRARHRGLDRIVAVKYLSEALAGRPGMAERFVREARVMARLQHPRIVAVYDVGEDEGLPYLVMECVPGRSLATLLPLSPERAVDVAIGVCEALEAAHAHGVVHRDIKPENILVDDAGDVKVADFGIARVLGEAGLTRTGGLVGTPAYMSPEALTGAPPDVRMDVYAVGAMLYQCVTGVIPAGAFAPLAPALDRVVRRAMAPADRRYPSAAALRHDLVALRALLDVPDPFPHEEHLLKRVVALVLTAASGTIIAAVLVSVTPRVLAPEDVRPLVMVGLERFADGRFLSRARFEEGPLLAAVAAAAAAGAAWALLLWHWRQDGLLQPAPDRRVPETRWLLWLALVACFTGFARRALLPPTALIAPFIPLLGGAMELGCLALFWSGLLEARRTLRPLTKEPGLFLGMGVAVIPPAVELWGWLTFWTP